MYSQVYDRLCGWLLFAAGVAGVTMGSIGDYARFTPLESWIHLGCGILLMAAARSRHRNAVLAAVLFGVTLFLWGIWGLGGASYPFGTAEPLESAVRLVAGAWGMYIAVQDVLDWRRS